MNVRERIDYSDPAVWARSGTEHGHQAALMAWRAIHVASCPALEYLIAIPNGGSRGDSKQSATIQGGIMKAEGVKRGVSDLFLPVPMHGLFGLWIEMKKPKGRESKEQIEWGAAMIDQGYWYCCCDHWLKAALVLCDWLGMEGERQAIVTRFEAEALALPY